MNRKEFQQLMNKTSGESNVLSVYLNTDQKEKTSEKIRIEAKDLLKKASEQGMQSEAEKIEEHIKQRLPKEARSMIFFVSDADNLFEILEFKAPAESKLVIAKKPHVVPLFKMHDEYEKYAIIMVSKSQMRLLSAFMGEIVEHLSKEADDFPGAHKKGGWSQARFQRHVEDHTHRTLKDAAHEAHEFMKHTNAERVILAGSSDVLTEFHELLHPDVQKCVKDSISLEMDLSKEQVYSSLVKVQNKVERDAEAELVQKLVDHLGDGNKAVRGLDRVAQAMNEAKVMTLIIDSNLSEPGKKCLQCGAYAIEQIVCDFCGSKTEHVADLVSDIVETAIEKSIKVEFVTENQQLHKNKHIGALLRF